MRLLHVSAHYPPNFVSGGTLVPQRLAQGLQARGHDVSVFAGYLDEDRLPLSTWQEQVDGVPVRWVAVTPWTLWSARNNFDNAPVSEIFGEHLRRERPDVVHLHSLQALGSGLVPVARAAGARVVVTMHDFWWLCARQFLVDPEHRPCSLVVDCGLCPCEVDHAWLRRRDVLLRERLQGADLVLAPSASAARVLAANGLAPERLRVDENGLPSPSTPSDPRPRQPGAPVRMLFAGGTDPMKGWPVLEDALRRMADVPGWTLDAHGVPPSDRLPVGVRPRPAYGPTERDDVLGAHDLLVLPSLMRESHSILTREALSAGLAVVCTDTLGPEEVVTSGENGLVVPAGDAQVLAEALTSLVRDPALLDRMRSSGVQAPVRTLDDQVLGLEQTYRQLLASGWTEPARAAVRSVLFLVGIEGAPLRYRVRLAAEGLATVGVACEVVHYRDERLPALAQAADAVVLYRVPATHQVLQLVDEVKRRPEGVPLLFDVDDLIFDESVREEVRGISHLPEDEVALWWQGVRRYRTTMEACDVYIGSTDELVEHAAAVTGMPARPWENGVGALLAQASDVELARPRRPGPLRLGYFSGTDTHDHDWAKVEPAVLDVMRRHGELELWLGGYLTPTPALSEVAHRVRRLPFVPWFQLPALLRDLDVNLAPLELGGRFNDAKSAIKWLEAALVATPTVASPTRPFRDAVDDGVNGMLADTSDQWRAALESLVTDDGLRRRIGDQARRDALLRWSPHLQARRYLDILEQARDLVQEQGHRSPHPGWVPEALDEPFQPMSLEPYATPVRSRAAVHPHVRAAARRVVRVGRTRLRALRTRVSR